MKLTNLPETIVDWSQITPTRTTGATGAASVRALRTNDVQMRIVDYHPGYLADHWCSKGHLLYVISGELTIEHQDGRETYELAAGMSWRSADEEGSPHRVRTESGAEEPRRPIAMPPAQNASQTRSTFDWRLGRT